MAHVPSPEPLILRSRVAADADGSSLLDYLVARFPYHDRERWQQEVAAGRVVLAGVRASGSERVRTGDTLAYHKIHREPWVDDHIPVLHEDAALLVVDKPAHLPMHADGPFVKATLVALLRARTGEQQLSLVHRLDRETSGVCVLARTAAARAALHEQFERGAVAKAYLAVVRGAVAGDFEVAAPIGRARDSRIALRRATGSAALDPRPARTRFVLVERTTGCSLLRCEPHTGRTHQIRVHLESAGHPILGDKLYGHPDDHYLAFVQSVKRSGDPRAATTAGPDRQLLHASSLTFVHPGSGTRVSFAAPLPALFEDWLHRDGRDSG